MLTIRAADAAAGKTPQSQTQAHADAQAHAQDHAPAPAAAGNDAAAESADASADDTAAAAAAAAAGPTGTTADAKTGCFAVNSHDHSHHLSVYKKRALWVLASMTVYCKFVQGRLYDLQAMGIVIVMTQGVYIHQR